MKVKITIDEETDQQRHIRFLRESRDEIALDDFADRFKQHTNPCRKSPRGYHDAI